MRNIRGKTDIMFWAKLEKFFLLYVHSPAALTPEEEAEIEAAEKMPIIFDDDCPEMTDEMLKQFHRLNTVMIKISSVSMKKIRAFGADYPQILSHLLDLALNDSELIKKCMIKKCV